MVRVSRGWDGIIGADRTPANEKDELKPEIITSKKILQKSYDQSKITSEKDLHIGLN